MKSQEPDYQPLDKETALKHVEAVEMKKAVQMAGAVVAQKMGQIPAEQMPLVA